MSSAPCLSLALPTKAAKSVVPPLRRGEMIEAMAQRKFAQLQEEGAENQRRRDRLNQKITEIARKVSVQGQAGSSFSFSINKDWNDSSRRTVSFDFTHKITLLPAQVEEIAALVKEMEAIPYIRADMKSVRRMVRDQISGASGDRVAGLLKDKASVRAIDEMLAKLENKPAIAIEG